MGRDFEKVDVKGKGLFLLREGFYEKKNI